MAKATLICFSQRRDRRDFHPVPYSPALKAGASFLYPAVIIRIRYGFHFSWLWPGCRILFKTSHTQTSFPGFSDIIHQLKNRQAVFWCEFLTGTYPSATWRFLLSGTQIHLIPNGTFTIYSWPSLTDAKNFTACW